MPLQFLNKVVVITGGGGVLCSAMALAMAKEGAKVAVLDLDAAAVEKVAEEIKQAGFTAMGLCCDVLSPDNLHDVHRQILTAFGPCDILVNGAGGNHPDATVSKSFLRKEDLQSGEVKTFFDLQPGDFKFVFDLNFLGTFLPTQVFARDMMGREGCTVINISSMNAFRPLTKIPAYSSAKAAVSNFTQWLAVYFARVGIRVNAIAPGFFLTSQTRFLLTNEDGSLSERGRSVTECTPMGRFGDPEDLIGTLFWLCGDASKFVTGIVVPVDGGFSAFSGV